jgi:hypothetical protein
MDRLNLLVQNPLFAIIGFLLNLIGVILAVHLYRRGRRFNRLSSAVRDFSLMREYATTIPNVQISYDGKPVRTLTVSRLSLWNSGTSVLHGNDIASADPIQIESDNNSDLLHAEMIETTNRANQVTLGETSTASPSRKVSFDFLNPGDGAVWNITHTGRTIKVIGQIKGARGLHQTVGDFPRPPSFVTKAVIVVFVANLLFMPLFIYLIANRIFDASFIQSIYCLLSFMLLVAVVLGNYEQYRLRKLDPIQKGFDEEED